MIPWAILALAALVAGGRSLYRFGVRRGRELEQMELPTYGAIHTRDGRVFPVRAESASDAVVRVAHLNWRTW